MKFTVEFGILALVLIALLYLSFFMNLQMPMYFAWLLGANLVTFVFYGLDKGLARIELLKVRVPELVLNLLALGGGFFGAWLGRTIWRHKTNVRKHPVMFAILMASTILHVGGIYLWFSR